MLQINLFSTHFSKILISNIYSNKIECTFSQRIKTNVYLKRIIDSMNIIRCKDNGLFGLGGM